MKVGEFARRARARRVEKKALFEEAFERAKAELRALEPAPVLVPVPVRETAERQRSSDRPILRLPRKSGR
jgi:hypothetical protein